MIRTPIRARWVAPWLILLAVLLFPETPDAAGVAPAVNSALGCTNSGDTYQYNGSTMVCSPITGGTISGADVSGANVTAAGSSAAITLANRFSYSLNIKSYGAYGNAQSNNTEIVSTTSGNPAFTIAGNIFSSADVGKRLNMDGAGPLRTLGYLSSVPVTAPGGSYTATPAVTLGGLGSAVGVVALADMSVQSAAVAVGGTGCPISTPITLTFVGGTGTAAQVIGTTNGSGVLTGSLTVAAAGSYTPGTATTALLPLTAVATTSVSTCSTYPTVNPSWGVGAVSVVGAGMNVPLTGVTASLSTGSGTLGTPVVSQVVTPWAGNILTVGAFSGGTQTVTLDTNASQTISAVENVTWGNLDDAAFTLVAADVASRFASGASPCIYLPASRYFISQSVATFYHNPVCINGDGTNRTVIKLDANMTGPALSWSEDWFGGGAYSPIPAARSASLSTTYLSPIAANFSIQGDSSVASEQDGIVLYDRNDRVILSHVVMEYLWGRATSAGVSLKNTTQAYLRESYWEDVYSHDCGNPAVPVYEFNSIGNENGTDTNIFEGMESWSLNGQGLVVRSQVSVWPTNYMFFDNLRIENAAGNIMPFSEDMIQIGDATQTGVVSNVVFKGVHVIDIPAGANGISFRAPSSSFAPFSVGLEDVDLFGPGNGINIAAGSHLHLSITSMSMTGVGVSVGASPLVTIPIYIEGRGAEQSWTWNLTANNQGVVLLPVYRAGDPTQPGSTTLGGGFAANVHDGSTLGGLALVAGAVDLQQIRVAANQMSGGQYSTIGGGRLNSISTNGIGAVIPGGSGNVISSNFSFVCCQSANDLLLNGHFVYGSADFTKSGDAQFGMQPLMATTSGTTPALITAQNGGSATTKNQLNLPSTGGAFGFDRITVVEFDPTNVHACMFYVDGLLARRTNGASAAVIVGSPTITQSSCDSALTGSTLTVAADGTTGGIDFTSTGVSAVNLHVVGIPHLAEVQ